MELGFKQMNFQAGFANIHAAVTELAVRGVQFVVQRALTGF